MALGADKTPQFIASLVVVLLLAGCLGDGDGPDPYQENAPSYREKVTHGSTSAQAILAVWPWVTEPLMSATGNVVVTEVVLGTIDRPEGLQNATFVLEWDSLDPHALFSHGELEIGRIDTWATVDGTSPLTLTIDEDDWPPSEASLRFRAHDPDIGVAYYTSIELNLNMTFHLLIPEEEPAEDQEETPRGSNRPGA